MSTPTPDYDRDGITIYHADNRDIIKSLGMVDHVITDPPYSETTHANARTSTNEIRDGRGRDLGKILVTFDSIKYHELYKIFQDLAFMTHRWTVSFMEWRYIAKLEENPPGGMDFVRFGVWAKIAGTPQFTGDRPAQGWEGIAILHNTLTKMRWNGGGMPALYNFQVIKSSKPYPTQKPLNLVSKLIEQFTNRDELILDPFCGSGTTLVAAKKLGRRAIGIDKSGDAVEIAINRLRQGVMSFDE